jgi:hypothetical protein
VYRRICVFGVRTLHAGKAKVIEQFAVGTMQLSSTPTGQKTVGEGSLAALALSAPK